MNKLSSEDGELIRKIFDNSNSINENDELLNRFKKYLKTNFIECIVTSRNKIIFTYGFRVEKYLNTPLDGQLKEIVDNEHNGGGRSSYLKINDKEHIRSIYYYTRLKEGIIVFFYRYSKREKMSQLLDLIGY